MRAYVTIPDLVAMRLPCLPSSRRGVYLRAETEGWRAEVRGNRTLYRVDDLPEEVRAELARQREVEEMAVLASAKGEEFAAAPRGQDVALARAAAVRAVRNLVAGGVALMEARLRVAGDTGCSWRTLHRWETAVDGLPEFEWPSALLPGWKGPRKGTTSMHPDALEYAIADFLMPSRSPIAAVHRRTVEQAAARGWGEIPTVSTLRRLIDARVPQAVQTLRRHGPKALEQKFPAQRRVKTHLRSMERVNGDGHKFDVMVEWPNRDGSTQRVRPILVAWQDVYSGRILAWRIDRTENVDGVRLAFADMVRAWGVPEHVHVDNGHAWAGKAMTGGQRTRRRYGFDEGEMAGIYQAFGVQAHFAQPYHGQSKPIERAFRDLCTDIARHPFVSGAYTGNAPHAKPDDYGTRAVPLSEFVAFVGRQIEAHNARPGRATDTAKGRSFAETFDAAYDASRVRRPTGEQIEWLLLTPVTVKVRTDEATVVVLGNRFGAPELLEHQGERVIVRYDPLDVQKGVWVFPGDAPLRPLCHARCIVPSGFDSADAARRDQRERAAWKRAVTTAASIADAVDVRQVWQDEIAPRKRAPRAPSNVVRGAFGRAVPEPVKQRRIEARAEDVAAVLANIQADLDRERVRPELTPEEAAEVAEFERLAFGK